jgi:hypothetical protein
MKSIKLSNRSIVASFLAIFILSVSFTARAELKPKERNILANEAKSIDLAKAMITGNTWNKLPGTATVSSGRVSQRI